MNKVYLGLGSNLGDKVDNLNHAIKILKETKDIFNVKSSSFYETKPVGFLDQDSFVNIVTYLETNLDPYELLDICQDIENQLKRKRLIRWGPRTIDVDILLFNDIINKDEKLLIPHPRMTERGFVIVPLFELNEDLLINGEMIKVILSRLDLEGIRKI